MTSGQSSFLSTQSIEASTCSHLFVAKSIHASRSILRRVAVALLSLKALHSSGRVDKFDGRKESNKWGQLCKLNQSKLSLARCPVVNSKFINPHFFGKSIWKKHGKQNVFFLETFFETAKHRHRKTRRKNVRQFFPSKARLHRSPHVRSLWAAPPRPAPRGGSMPPQPRAPRDFVFFFENFFQILSSVFFLLKKLRRLRSSKVWSLNCAEAVH